MRTQIVVIVAVALVALGACGSEITRTFALTPMGSLAHGQSLLIGDTLVVEMGGAEALSDGYRWVAWVESDAGTEVLGEIQNHVRLETDTTTLATAMVSVEDVLISEEAVGATMPASPSNRIWMHGEFPGPLHMLGLAADAFDDASAEVLLDKKQIEVSASGLPALPTGFAYVVWLDFGADAHADEHGTQEPTMPQRVGELGGGVFMENHLATLTVTAEAAMVTIESRNGIAMMSPVMPLHGEVVFVAGEISAAAPSEPAVHSH